MLNRFHLVGILMAGILLLLPSVSAISYIHGVGGQLIASINESGNITYYHSDHLGSSSVLTNEGGAITSESVYLPFGLESSVFGPEPKYGFTGKEFEPDLNLNYFLARYYNPEIGRFLRVDPALSDWTSYSYANNNPLKYTDPDGRFPAAAGAIAVVGGGNGWNPIGWALLGIAGGVTVVWAGHEIYDRYIKEDTKPKQESVRRSNHRSGDVPVKPARELPQAKGFQVTGMLTQTEVVTPTVLWGLLREEVKPAEKIPLSYWAVGKDQVVNILRKIRKEEELTCIELSVYLIYELEKLNEYAFLKELHTVDNPDALTVPAHVYVGTNNKELGDIDPHPETNEDLSYEERIELTKNLENLIGIEYPEGIYSPLGEIHYQLKLEEMKKKGIITD